MIFAVGFKTSLFLQGTDVGDDLGNFFGRHFLLKGKHDFFAFFVFDSFLYYLCHKLISKIRLNFRFGVILDLKPFPHRCLALAISPVASLAILQKQFLTCFSLKKSRSDCEDHGTRKSQNKFFHAVGLKSCDVIVNANGILLDGTHALK